MKILMIAPEPIFQPRGTPLSVVGRLKAFSDMGHEVDLVTYPIGETVRLPHIQFLRTRSIPGIRNVKIGPSLTKLPLDFLLMLKTFDQLRKKKYDFVHTHEEAGLWGTAFSRWFGVPHIYDMHSSLPQQLGNFNFTSSKWIKRLFDSLENWILKYASAVITICPDLESHVAAQFPERGSILIENVLDYATVFGETDQSNFIRSKYNLDGKKVALYAGTFEPYQGLDMLIRAAEVVLKKQSIQFLMVGGHPEQVQLYQKQVDDAGLSSNFTFTGQVKPQEVPSYMRCSDLLLSPRISGTNTPLKIYSYLRSGLPIVATRMLTHTQVLSDETAELTGTSPEAFAEGILHAIKDSKSSQNKVKNAQKLAADKYSTALYKEKLMRCVHLAIERGV
ncbi:glycosyltransferase family 4 protein [candidate division KSB1 bacterium]|nr:glycosyltransferase family 4 protein [candidate division KSB1 bacterium]